MTISSLQAVEALHVFVLFCLAIAQPLFEVFADTPQYFVAGRSQPIDILLLVLLVTLGCPALITLLELAVGLVHPALRRGLHLLVVAVLLAALALPWIRLVAGGMLPGLAILTLAGLLGAAGAAAYARARQVRRFLTYLSFVLLVFPALFLFNSSVTELVFPLNGTLPIMVALLVLGCGLLGLGLLLPRFADRPVSTRFASQRRRVLLAGGTLLLGLGAFASLGRRLRPEANAEAESTQARTRQGSAPAVASAAGTDAPVVVVIFDEFPLSSLLDKQRQIDAASFPNFARLAGRAHWFRNATTVADFTVYAVPVPAILSGLYPSRSQKPTSKNYPVNLFTTLGASHEMRAIESTTRLCPDELCPDQLDSVPGFETRMRTLASDVGIITSYLLLPQDLTGDLPTLDNSWSSFSAAAGRPDAQRDDIESGDKADGGDSLAARNLIPHELFARFLGSLAAPDRPRVHVLHVMLPHRPWRYLPSGTYFNPDETMRDQNGVWSADPWVTLQFYQRHLLQVAYMDKLVGDLLAKLEETELYDPALVVVTADHGVSFKPGLHSRKITQDNFEDILPVPLFIKLPAQREGALSERNVQTIDILPTIAHLLGVQLPAPVDGIPIFDASRQEPPGKTLVDEDFQIWTFGPTIDQLDSAIQRKLALFGSGADAERLFRIGPYPDLIGLPTGQLNVVGSLRATAALSGDHGLQNHDPGGSYVPAQLTGRIALQDATDKRLNLAVSVNGVVQAVVQTYPDDAHTQRLSALVPESAFAAGPNHVALFSLSGPMEQHEARVVEVKAPRTFALQGSGNDMTITSSEGAGFRIEPKALEGSLETVEVCGPFATMTGWAADPAGEQIVDALVMFAGDRQVWAGPTMIPRHDIVKAYTLDALLVSGFKAFLPLNVLGEERGKDLRVFALSKRGVASELKRPSKLIELNPRDRACHL
jgi:hypothetical protein